ncbi:hypothetical protein LK994_04385 [Ferruginibacter lapsinanis]|uniref:hypothetical protein n=1 Tax=Ferruginibacter lapsinanis TaxID=563172 RepID=UPI001E5113CC|nr:hypothetical protein [Ferruginibacter lapsinanis]UEG50710.1 hypothetical protein LK994_04385 [Ferruginibacter lapsinanis]
MKQVFSIPVILRCFCWMVIFGNGQNLFAQSPSLSVELTMDSIKRDFTNYKIEMKICEPKVKTNNTDWFNHDTSRIIFDSLKAADIMCDNYFESGEGIKELSDKIAFQKYNSFRYSNQLFAWEKILIYKIANYSSRAWYPEMYIVLPIRYKSFVTKINLTSLVFESGKVIYLDGKNAVQTSDALNISYSLKDEKGIDANEFLQKELLN